MLLNKMEKFIAERKDLTIISLSVLTSLELKKRGIKYKTPDLYFDKSMCDKLDNNALKFAKNWYNPFEKELSYKGVSLGEMLEHDFYFLFVDILRCIKIAEKIVEIESPDEIFLPKNMKMNEVNFACYENLPNALHFLSDEKKSIRVIIIDGVGKSTKSLENWLHKLRIIFFDFFTIIINFYQIYLYPYSGANNIILSWGLYSYSDMSKVFKEKGYSYINLYPLRINNNRTKKKINEIKNLSKRFNSEFLELKFEGINLFSIFENRIDKTFLKIEHLIQYLEWADKIMQKFPINILISMEDVTPLKRSIFRLFKIKNLPSLIIQHGMVSRDMAGFLVMPLESRNQAVWGENSLKWHVERGNTSQVITGNPSYDKINNYKRNFNKENVCHNLGIDLKKKVILITTERFSGITSKYTVEYEERFIRNIIKSLKHFKSEQKIVKLHPAYQNKYNKIIKKIANEERVDLLIFKDSLWDLILVADVLITYTSTTGLEAMLFDKPVISLGLDDAKSDVDEYISKVAAIGVYNLDELVIALNEVLYGDKIPQQISQKRKSLIYDSAYLQDGKATERVVNLISEELNK